MKGGVIWINGSTGDSKTCAPRTYYISSIELTLGPKKSIIACLTSSSHSKDDVVTLSKTIKQIDSWTHVIDTVVIREEWPISEIHHSYPNIGKSGTSGFQCSLCNRGWCWRHTTSSWPVKLQKESSFLFTWRLLIVVPMKIRKKTLTVQPWLWTHHKFPIELQ